MALGSGIMFKFMGRANPTTLGHDGRKFFDSTPSRDVLRAQLVGLAALGQAADLAVAASLIAFECGSTRPNNL
jgi:hypothetical protein